MRGAEVVGGRGKRAGAGEGGSVGAELEREEAEALRSAYSTLNPLSLSAALAMVREAASSRGAAAAAEARGEASRLAGEAAALLDGTPMAYDHPSAPLIQPWTVGDRRPSGFYFKQLDHVVLFLLTIPAAYNSARTVGASQLPYSQSLALQVCLLLAVVLLMGLSAAAAIRFGVFREAEQWKHKALLAVFALTALSGLLNFVSWVGDEVAGASVGTLLLCLAGLLFVCLVLLLLYLITNFFLALQLAAKAEAEEAAKKREGLLILRHAASGQEGVEGSEGGEGGPSAQGERRLTTQSPLWRSRGSSNASSLGGSGRLVGSGVVGRQRGGGQGETRALASSRLKL